MRKVLSMALMLMMVFTLLAVPAMASTVSVDLVVDGTFEESVDGAAVTAPTANKFGLGTYGTAVTKKVDGNMVYAGTSDTRYSRSSYATNKFAATAEELFQFTFDVYATSPNAEGGANARIDFNTAGKLDHASRTWSLTDLATCEAITGLNSSNRQRVIFPINTWVRISVPLEATEATDAAYAQIDLRGIAAAEEVMYVDNVSLTKQVAGSYINVTETNDFGTVTAPESVLATETAEIKVVAEPGYYLAAATLNGEPVTFTKPTTTSYEVTSQTYAMEDSATARVYKEQWTYTLDASTLDGDANFEITYGAYTQTPIFSGDAESADQDFSGENATIVDTENNGGSSSFYLEEGSLGSERYTWEVGKYLIKWDAKATTANTAMRVYGVNNNTMSGARADRYYLHDISVPTTNWKSYTVYMDVKSQTVQKNIYFSYASGVYFDNISVVKLTEGGIPVPEVYDVTITAGANANASVSAATSEGEAVNFTVAPKFGYYIQSITIGGTPFNGFDAYKGGTYTTGAIEADTEIVVTVAELSANTEEGVSTDVATLPAVFAEAGEAPVTFGKVLADVATVDEFGIYLTKDGEGVTSAKTEMGPHFKAFYNVNGQYAIEFQGLEAGEYVAQTYVKVAGEITYGIATTFTVE